MQDPVAGNTAGKSARSASWVFLAVFLIATYAPFLSVVNNAIAARHSEQPSPCVRTLASMHSWRALLIVAREGIKAPFEYFATDAFYYLTVAHNSVGMRFYTFDRTFPTNGFHPLWQFCLTRIFILLHGNQEAEILVTFYLSVLLTALGSSLFALALLELTRSAFLALLGTVPGIYYLLFSQINQFYDAQWSFVNGMESPLSILLFGLLLYVLVARKTLLEVTRKKILLVSGLVTLLILSRLDDVFLLASLFALLGACRRTFSPT
jgi:hypothetical protein